jgi:PKD repeat protein
MKSKLGSLFTFLALVAGVHQAAAQGTTDFPIATNGAASQAGIFAAFGRTNYLVGIQGDGTTNSTAISAQLISTNGTLLGPRILTGRTGGIPYVAFGGTKFLLVWSDNALVAAGGNDQVYGQFVTQSGTLVGSPFSFGPTSEEQDMQGGGGSLLAFDGNNYLAVWDTGGFHDSPGGDIHGALFSQTGSLVVPIIPITSEMNGALTPTVAFGKTNYLVVWNNRRPTGPEEYDIYGEFISTNGTQGNAFVISQTPTPSYDPCCAAFDGTNFMVVWSKNIGLGYPNPDIWNLYGRVLSADGSFPGSEVAMVTDTNNPEVPSLAFDGANYLLAWNVEELAANSQIVFEFFNSAASSIGQEFYLFSEQGTNTPLVGGVLFDGNRFEITAVVGGATGTGSEGTDFTTSTGTYGAFFSTNPAASLALGYAYTTNAGGLTLTITGYSGPGGAVTVPSTINNLPVTSIGVDAFADNSLTSVTIPGSVTNIGNDAFLECSSLASVYFEGNAPTVGLDVFDGDPEAAVYYLPGTAGWADFSADTGLPAAVLYSCTTNAGAITITGYYGPGGAVTIPSTINNLPVTSIGYGAFIDCASLTSVTIGTNATSIGVDAFSFCTSLTSITIPNSVTSLLDNAFADTGLTSVIIPDSVTSIGAGAFEQCSNLTSVTILGSVTNMGDYVFVDCTELTNATIGNGVTSIGNYVFGDCFRLAEITVGSQNLFYSSVNGVLFDKNQTTLIEYPGGLVGGYIIPSSVTSIGESAFEACTNLTSVTIPGSVTNIEDFSFQYCYSLSNVTIPNSVTSVGESAFYYCTNLAGAIIGNSVTNIGDFAFYYCPRLASVTIPASVTSLGTNAFSYCYELIWVYFQGNAPSADSSVFYADPATAYYLPDTAGWSSTFAGIAAYLWDPQLPCGYTITNGTITIDTYLGSGGAVIIPSEIDGLPVTSIGEYAFEVCQSLTGVTIPNGVTSIGEDAFYFCTNLASVTIPNSVTSIGGSAFSLTGLTSVTIPSSASIGDFAFYGCTNLTSLTIQNGVIGIGEAAFEYCTSLTSVSIPSSASISYYGFQFCTNLTNVFIQGNAPGAVFEVFGGDNKATFYYLQGTTGWGSPFEGDPAIELTAISITANPTNGTVPITVSFTSAAIDSSGHPITNRTWSFGDGSASTEQNPSHTYTNSGTFSVALVETNDNGVPIAGSEVSITVPAYSGLVLNGGFETGDFTGWTLMGGTTLNGETYNAVVNATYVSGAGVPYVHSGTYGAALGQSGFLATLSQSLSTVSGQRYLLSFWLENPTDLPTQIFMVNWNTNSSSTNNVYAVTNPPVFTWSNFTFVVTAAGTNTTLQFAAENDQDSFGLDDISVLPAQLGIASTSISGTNLVLNGTDGLSGGTYYVLMSSNLALPLSQWTPVATNVLSASGNFTITVTNTVSPNLPQSFYTLQTQ